MITNPTYRRLQSLGTEPTVAVLLASSSFTAQQAREAGVGFTTFTTGLILLFKTTLLKSGWHVKKKKRLYIFHVYISTSLGIKYTMVKPIPPQIYEHIHHLPKTPPALFTIILCAHISVCVKSTAQDWAQ